MAKKGWSKKGVSQDQLKKKDEQKGRSGGGQKFKPYIDPEIDMFVPHQGANKIRIIQPLELDEIGYYGLEVHFHRKVGPMEDHYHCNKRMFSKKCPICEKQTGELWDTDYEYAKSLYPDTRYLFWVLDLSKHNTNKEKVFLWSCPRTLQEAILGQSHRKSADVYLDVSHPEEGRAIYFDREGTGIGTKYVNIQLEDESDELDESLIDQMKEFMDCLILCTYDEVKAADEGEVYEPEAEEEEASEEQEPEEEEQEPEEVDEEEASGDEDEPSEEWDGKVPEDCKDCFQKEFDEYEECAECSVKYPCEHNLEPPKPKKKKKEKKAPAKKQKRTKPSKESTEKSPSDNKDELRSRLKSAIRKRKSKE